MSSEFLGKKTRADVLLEKALLDSVLENPIHCGSGKTGASQRTQPISWKAKKRLLRKSSEQWFKQKETVGSRYSSLTTATYVKPHVLEKKRLTLSYPSQSSIIGTSDENMQWSRTLKTKKSEELKLDYQESNSSVEVFEKPANNDWSDEDSDDYYSSSLIEADSEISDWMDEFSYPESDTEFNAAKSSSESTDSSCYSFSTEGSRSTSPMLKPTYESTLKPKDLPPAGMLFAGYLNSKIGNRFKTFQQDAKLQTVIDWLGTPLPIVIKEAGRSGRRCDSDLTLAQALGKMLKSPSQKGIAFFTGPVNGKLSYLMTIVDLDQLCALKGREDEKLEKLKSWI